MASLIFWFTVNTVSFSSRYTFSVVSLTTPSACFFRITKDTQKWLRR